jgi:hypothetical protein
MMFINYEIKKVVIIDELIECEEKYYNLIKFLNKAIDKGFEIIVDNNTLIRK